MRIAVLGTGMVGRALAGRLAGLGHQVAVGTRDPEDTLDRTGPDSYTAWAEAHPGVELRTFADAVADADLIVNATQGAISLAVLESAEADRLDGTVLMDLSNPLDLTDTPGTLLVKDSDSMGEQIQRSFPRLRVVKTLNTLNASLMVEPRTLADGDHTVFVCGADADAKAAVTGVLESFGHTDVLDLGDITASRGVEMYLPVWLRLWQALGTAHFNLKIVR
jgi:predicted dinucleotide-binding enzyme